jgi:adenine-specific DNA-methyltransferase
MDERFKNPDNDPRGPWSATDLTRAEHRDRDYWGLVTPSGKTVYPAKGRSWSRPKENIEKLVTDERLWFGPNGSNLPRLKKFLSEMDGGLTPQSIWLHSEVGNNQEAKKEILQLDSETVFDTPKPERLLQRVLHLATYPGDLVLDSFLGSGTTAAVAHKMGRHWIGIEMGEHATTHCVPRLLKVIDGEQGGISAAVGWQGGGGFQLLQLGAPLFDEQGDIHPEVRFADLAAFIWMRETGTALPAQAASGTLPLLGVHEGTAYYLLFNGILGDRRPASGNVLTTAVLQALNELCGHDGPKVIYGEACRLGDARLKAEDISFKQLPHAVPR